MKVDGISVFSGVPVRVDFEGGQVTATSPLPNDREGPYISPGFVDLQVNGYQGLDYSSETLSAADVEKMILSLAASGTTTHLPTIITNARERILRNLGVLSRARRQSKLIAACIPGYHIEGPFISPLDGPRGAHSPKFIRNPDLAEFQAWQDAADGRILIVTLAPEVPGALEFIEKVAETGVLVAIGHTGASPETIRDAVQAGAVLSTHLGNGSHASLPRLNNYVWEQLASDELSAGIICDGFHLPKSVIKSIVRAKGLDRLFLVSDVAVHGGRQPGIYRWGDVTVEVFTDGHLGLHNTQFLAGAGHLLDWDIARFLEATGAGIEQAVRLCTVNPLNLLGMNTSDFLAVGEEANHVIFDYSPDDTRLSIRKTIRQDQILFAQ